MTFPLVSVIVPAFNAVSTIGETLRSANEQTYRPIEIIVIDDGSTDGTSAAVAEFGDAVRYMAQENAGDAAARNTGIGEARGGLVAFLDADDLWRKDKLERQVGSLLADGSVGGIQCGALYIDDRLRPIEEHRCRPGRMELMDVLLFRDMPAFSSAIVIRRECIDRIGPIDLSVRGKDEWDFAIRIARGCGLASVPDPLVIRRMYASSTSRQAAYAQRQVRPGLEILRRVFTDPTLPEQVRWRRRRAYAAFYRMIAGSYAQAHAWPQTLGWAARAAATHPGELAYLVLGAGRRLGRIFGAGSQH